MSAGAPEASAVGGRIALAPSTHVLTASESAWLALLPCFVLLLALVLLVRPGGLAAANAR